MPEIYIQPGSESVRSAVESVIRATRLQTHQDTFDVIVALRREADRLEERLSLELLADTPRNVSR